MSQRLTYRQHLRAVLGLGLPLVGSHLAQFAITLTDAVMLGWYSVEALAAEVLGGTLFFVLFIMGSGFAWAVMPMVARAASSGEEAQVRRVTRMGLWASALFALACLPVTLGSATLFRVVQQACRAAVPSFFSTTDFLLPSVSAFWQRQQLREGEGEHVQDSIELCQLIWSGYS